MSALDAVSACGPAACSLCVPAVLVVAVVLAIGLWAVAAQRDRYAARARDLEDELRRAAPPWGRVSRRSAARSLGQWLDRS